MMEASVMVGDDFSVAMLDTAQGLVQVGAMICYDREFPESARVPDAEGGRDHSDSQCLRDGAARKAQLQRAPWKHGGRGAGELRGPAG